MSGSNDPGTSPIEKKRPWTTIPVITVETGGRYDENRDKFPEFYRVCHAIFEKWHEEYSRLSFREGGFVCPTGEFRYASKEIVIAKWHITKSNPAGYLAIYGFNYPSQNYHPPFEASIEEIIDVHLRIRLGAFLVIEEKKRQQKVLLVVSGEECRRMNLPSLTHL